MELLQLEPPTRFERRRGLVNEIRPAGHTKGDSACVDVVEAAGELGWPGPVGVSDEPGTVWANELGLDRREVSADDAGVWVPFGEFDDPS